MAVQYAFGKIITNGLALAVDAADPNSYPGTGTTWRDLITGTVTGSLVSCSFSSDFKGGIVFNNPTSSVQFPGSIANYGTSSFTAEMAFRPAQINGIHYLISDNSGSFPSWGVYLSGSGGTGKLWAEYRISSTVSCSVSSSTIFVTGSNYLVDAVFSPLEKRTYINVDGVYNAISAPGNGTGSLTTTASILLGNTVPSSSQAFSGSIFNTKIYSSFNSGNNNYRTISQRLQKVPPLRVSTGLALVIGGGGSAGGSSGIGGGGGGGGFVLTSVTLTASVYNVFVGDGGAQPSNITNSNNGQNSSIADIIAYGGGGGGHYVNSAGSNGASGGGGGASNSGATIAAGSAIYGTQGNNGGTGGTSTVAGGGGGAGAPGQSSVGLSRSGNGGDGLASLISGVMTYYAGGGGGGGFPLTGSGGIGGGANGSAGYGIAGSPNTGGGGGGSGYTSNPAGGKGGSGIVIIRYPGGPIATGGTITQIGGDTIHTFTATGSHTFTVF
jgi:hypothetical protein